MLIQVYELFKKVSVKNEINKKHIYFLGECI
jgi:hypothetical protein